jgi:ParB-like chromosome segregation protein Spo0J
MPAHEHINQNQLRNLRALDFPMGDGSYYTVGSLDPELSFDMEHYNTLKEDIVKNGIKEPIVVDSMGNHKVVLDGHHRAVIAKELGMPNIPVNDVT